MATKEISAQSGSIAYDGSGIGNSPTFNINHVARFSSLLNPLLEAIIKKYDPSSDTTNTHELPDPDEKLDFNKVMVFSEDIEDCIGFLYLVEELIDTIDNQSPGAKNRFLRSINQNYKKHKRQLLIENNVAIKDKEAVIATIRENSDTILQNVITSIIENAETELHAFSIEDVTDSAMLIVCYGFINCKILERPSDY